MKQYLLRCVSLMFLTTALSVVEAQGQELTVSDMQKSGCLTLEADYDYDKTPVPTIILEKEGSVLSVQVLNYESNCATRYFEVNSSIGEGYEGAPCSLSVNIAPVYGEAITTCTCPFNVSFTLHDLEQNSFYLKCWWYEGLVELEDGETLVLEDVYEDVTIDGTDYTLRKTMQQAMVKKSEWVGEVCLPSEVSYEGHYYSVTSMEGDAFSNNTALTKITIPRTIKNLNFDEGRGFDRNPFIGCTALESIEVEEGNPALCSIDGVLFNKGKTRLYTYPAAAIPTSYTVPEGVTRIEGGAFGYNQHLVTVSIPDEVSIMNSSVFYGCTNLEEVKLPSNIMRLEGWMFGNCVHLRTITIPESVTHLGISLFYGCTSLTSVVMPESVTSTDYAVFENCKSLKKVTLSPNLELINNRLFQNCSSMTEIHIPESVVSVMSNSFQNCTALKTVDLPESVCRLGSGSFTGCKLDSLLIRGIIDSRWVNEWLFDGMSTQTKIFVQPSEVEKYKKIYKGPVYPLPDETNDISDFTSPESNPSELFDLQGRRIIGVPSRGIYIFNKQKRVVK